MNFRKAISIPFDTPFMVIDKEQVARNISKMQSLANQGNKDLRPHIKTHKIPELAEMQLASGAKGICVQKVAEAEVMFRGSIRDIFLTNEIFGTKFNRLATLLTQGAEITVAIDNSTSVKQFSDACRFFGVQGHVIIDVNIGMNRCGIDSGDFMKLLFKTMNTPGIVLDGIMAYDGHVNYPEPEKRMMEVKREEKVLQPLIDEFKRKGIVDPVISVGGTPTAEFWAASPEVTEIQPGTYIYYDLHCMQMGLCNLDDIAIGVVSMITSEKMGERLVLDAGYKSVSIDQGVYPSVFDENGSEYKVISMSEEHTVLKSTDSRTHLGEKFIMLPYHACTTTDLWDTTYAISEERDFETIAIKARGKRE